VLIKPNTMKSRWEW